MTERERRKRRIERQRRMRGRQPSPAAGVFAFRAYVTAVLVGSCFVVSIFQTESSEAFCEKVRETISAQISAERISGIQKKAARFWEEKKDALPAFRGEETSEPLEEEEKKVFLPDTGESP